ncbi:hypothetical protein MATL_G00179360 [Megalops atlanticus]|uniref:Hemopexin n=1 Tax=Megalops atlanticus TaxID=7932 RepID=A0A9D3T272_MEGAT|nr:hypothetical protein MATL_G00179360 [Megalops atlanticus]
MRLLSQTLCLCLALALSQAAPSRYDLMMADHYVNHHHPLLKDDHAHHGAKLDRCEGIEFDAITPDEKGNVFFFKGDHLWKGYSGPAELANTYFKELDEHHHLGHVDAAFRMHYADDPTHHDHIFFFLDDHVFSYYNHILEEGYPKKIQEVFPGIPDHLDAAVECPKGECSVDSVIFFKENKVYHYDIATKTVKEKVWSHLPNCTSAYRWLERHYCFHGHNFTRFHPITGTVVGVYPKDARNYFMRCADHGHGHGDSDKERCKDAKLDAITSDEEGKMYAFSGKVYTRLDTHRDGWHAFSIASVWKEVESDVDAVFSYDQKMYLIKGDQVYIYKSAVHYTLIEGYPKSLKEELGIEGPVNAAFVCGHQPTVHIIKGSNMLDVDLSATPRRVLVESPLPFSKIDASMCGPTGLKVFVGSEYYEFGSPVLMSSSRIRPSPHKIPLEILGCGH